MSLRIGYYVHHHGRGHATRAGVIGNALRERGHDITFLGSAHLPEGQQIVLARDDEGTHFVDADAGGILHWAPLGGGYAERAGQIASWVREAQPDVVIVDVSVEVTLLVRLLGVPVVVVAQPGLRDDAPHALAYDAARAILAPWPAELNVAPHLRRWSDKVVHTGGLTRFVGAQAEPETGIGLILVGGEGWDDPSLPDRIRVRIPEIDWKSPADEPLADLLRRASVVVTHAGQNALADVAAFDIPAVVIAQQRPFDEQEDMAQALTAAGVAQGLPPSVDEDAVVNAIRAAHSSQWQCWGTGGAPDRAVTMIEKVASWQS